MLRGKSSTLIRNPIGKECAIGVALCLLACSLPAAAFDIFYVSVGNSHYRSVSTRGVHSFESISGGNKSARKVAEYLGRIGALHGILFRTEPKRFVTREQVLGALKEVIRKAKKYPNPIIFYYFIGHGISEGIGWNHFSVPSDFIGSLQDVNVDALSAVTLYTGEIFDLLESSNIRFIMMLDNCYEGDPVSLTSAVFSKSLQQNLNDIFQVLRFMNEFHKPNIVLYSTKPGTVASMAADPINPASNIGVGPLARRFLLIVDQALHDEKILTLENFLKQMTNPTLDTKTNPAVNFAELKDPKAVLVTKPPFGDAGKPDVRLGSGVPR